MDKNIINLRKALKEKLDPDRYEHSLSVSFTCVSLAMKYGYDLDRAEIAGLLHDCAKHYSDTELIKRCLKHHIRLTKEELNAPAVIHAKYGAHLAKRKYGINDEDILSAIACHTTGKAGMSLLDKILYTADYIEPRRYKAPNLPEIRKLAFEDLDETVFRIMRDTVEYLSASKMTADPATMEAYEAIKRERGL